MALRIIRLEDDELLRKKSREVKTIDQRILTLLDDMKETMDDYEGVGLAAPQVGVLKRVVVIDVGDGLLELINPQIVETKGEKTEYEGCLSIPGKKGKVCRPEKVKVVARNRFDEVIEVEGEGMLAVALCHEIDHLDGILYTDKMIEPYEDDVEDDEYEDDEE